MEAGASGAGAGREWSGDNRGKGPAGAGRERKWGENGVGPET